MAASKRSFFISLVIFFVFSVSGLPEPGKKTLHFDKNRTYGKFSKTMNKGYSVAIKGQCKGTSEKIKISWRLEVSECAERFSFLKDNDQSDIEALWNIFANHSLNGEQEVDCTSAIFLKDVTDEVQELIILAPPSPSTEESQSDETAETGDKDDENEPTELAATSLETSEPIRTTAPATATAKRAKATKKQSATSKKASSTAKSKPSATLKKPPNTTSKKVPASAKVSAQNRKRRSGDGEGTGNDEDNNEGAGDEQEKGKSKSADKEKSTEKATEEPKVENRVCVTKHDGVYLLIVHVSPMDKKAAKDSMQLTFHVEMKSNHGYLSASEWPLYAFYGFMLLLYIFYGIVWLIVSACQWRDLLRIQVWIGGVIAFSMLEKAVFFSEYNNINRTGEINPSLTIFAELVSCVKRTLARILIIIISMGFGIVKPRLGATLHRVLGVGALYFILATVEGYFRSLHPKSDPGKQQLIASIPLAVLDVSIFCWILMSLVQTTRTLRIQQNLIKLSLYRYFTNTLIFAVLASVAYMIWSVKTYRFAKDGCITDWSELWLDKAFWHILFSIVLLVIMVLWRPTANNQRYAFTPFVDFGDDDEDGDNMTLSDTFDGMKMRNVKNVPEVHINGDSKRKHKPEDDLKWVEENIPSSVADT